MLKLKKLQVLGFKSFCDRTELKFHGEGIAAIVGPNGCGKSNLADAITWVLGEQSAKSLRGSSMSDVIFAGTRERKPTGMAEVTLHLVDTEQYAGSVSEPEIDIQSELPEDDWDEASLRTAHEREVDEYTEEVRPGQTEAVAPPQAEGSAPGAQAAAPSPDAADDLPPSESALPAGEPQVVLKIRRRKFHTPYKKGEIAVTRRLFRSGESEYLLNGKLCRLRDIQDIFMGTGLGPESYAVIEQGRIGQILSSKPTDRRAIIEEAAGVTKYKARKRLAEARLEDAKQNLARMNDIFDEITRQMNSLKRQAAKANRHARLRDEMRAKLRVVLASRFAEMQAQAAALEAELSSLAEDIRARGEAVLAMEREHADTTQRGYALDDEARQVHDRLSQVALETDRAQARLRHNEESCAELAARSAGAEAEIATSTQQFERLQQELAANRQVLENAAADVAAVQAEQRERQLQAQSAAAALEDLEQRQEQRHRAVLEATNQAAAARNRITQAEESLAALEREALRLQGELESATRQVETFGGQRGQLALEFEGATQKAQSVATRIEEARATLAAKRAAETEGKQRLDTMRAEFATLQGKSASLEAVIREHGYSTDSVRRLLRSGQLQGGPAFAGVLADYIEVEDRFEQVVDEFLREELNFVVVKSWESADEGLNMLRHDVEGRATFLVDPENAQVRFPFVGDASTATHPQYSGIVPLRNCIRVLNGFGRSLEGILPKLGQGYIVPNAAIGRNLALENKEAFFLAESGECFHNVTVSGGKQNAEGPLAIKRELREVQRQMNDLERGLREQEGSVGRLGREIVEFTSLLENLESERRELDKQVMTSGHSLQHLDAEMLRVRQRLDDYKRELQRAAAESSERRESIAVRAQELATHDAERARLEAEMAAAQENLARLRADRDAAALAVSEVMARVAALEERHRSAAASLARIESMSAEVGARVGSLKAQLESASAEVRRREQENQGLGAQLVAWAAEQESLRLREAGLSRQSAALRARIVEIEQQLKSAREALDQVRDHRGEVSASAARNQSDMAHMAETCLQELGTACEELLADESIVRVAGEELAAEDAAYREMRTKLDTMGPVNMMALEEYKEAAAAPRVPRHPAQGPAGFHREHAEDDQGDRPGLAPEVRRAPSPPSTRTSSRPSRKLFGGGQAYMRLTDEENSAESGIDIVASPPGKKLQNVLLLSGGEKALTALSAAGRHLPVRAQPVLHSRRGGRAAGRSQHRTLHRTDARDERRRRSSSSSRTARRRCAWRRCCTASPCRSRAFRKIVSVRFGEQAQPELATA